MKRSPTCSKNTVFPSTSRTRSARAHRLSKASVKTDLIKETKIMTTDPDPFEQGQHAARKNIPAEGNPYRDGSEEHALWAAGHEEAAGEAEANESEGS